MAEGEFLLPQFFPGAWREEVGVFGIEFVEGVSIGFVTRESGWYSFLLADEFEPLGKSVPELLSVAFNNLSNLGEASLEIAYPNGSGCV